MKIDKGIEVNKSETQKKYTKKISTTFKQSIRTTAGRLGTWFLTRQVRYKL